MTNKFQEWEHRLGILKDHKMLWASKKKLMEEMLAGDKELAVVLKWLRSSDDPEESFRNIEREVTSEGRYPNCAEWILRTGAFKDWSGHLGSPGGTRPQSRMLWIKGPMGTGKTTIMCATYFSEASSFFFLMLEQVSHSLRAARSIGELSTPQAERHYRQRRLSFTTPAGVPVLLHCSENRKGYKARQLLDGRPCFGAKDIFATRLHPG